MSPHIDAQTDGFAHRESSEFEALTDEQLASLVSGTQVERLVDLDETTMDPAGGRSDVASPRDTDVEARLIRDLSNDTALEFDALTVTRVVDGVVVEGIVRGVDGRPEEMDLTELMRQISGLDNVRNRLVVVGDDPA